MKPMQSHSLKQKQPKNKSKKGAQSAIKFSTPLKRGCPKTLQQMNADKRNEGEQNSCMV